MIKPKLLYIEDDDRQRRSLTKQLRSRGFTVTPSKSGRTALGLFERRRFDVILCDLNMPRMDGGKILEKVRRRDGDIPFILLSAKGSASLAVKAIKRGADDFILKPAEINVISIAIQKAVEKRRLEKQLRDSEAMLRMVTENVPDFVYALDPAGVFLTIIASKDNSLEYSPDELIGSSVFDIIHPDDREALSRNFRSSIRAGDTDVRAITFRMISKSGTVRFFEIRRRHIYENERCIQSVGIARDVTEQHEAEERIENRLRYEEGLAALSQSLLKEAEAEDALDHALGHLRDAVRAGRVYIFENFMDETDGLCMRQTHEVCAPGVEPQIANPLLQHVPYEDGFERWRKLLENGRSAGGLVKNLSGPERAIVGPQGIQSILLIPITAGGRWHGFMGFDDMSEEREWSREDVRTLGTACEIVGSYIHHKQFEETLRISEERFRGLVENANDIIYSLSPEALFTYVSPKVTDVLGYEVAELLGKPLFPMLHPDDREQSTAWWRSGFEDHEEHAAGYEFRMLHKDGGIKWLTTKASPIYDEEGNVMMIIGVAHDITEMKRVLEELEEANRTLKETQIQLVHAEKMASLGQLVAGIAHEMNTPIGALTSMHDTLVRAMDRLKAAIDAACPQGAGGGSVITAALETIDDANRVIRTGAERVTTIVRRLRSFARLDEAELKTADIHEGLEDTLTLIHHEIKHNITVVKNYGDIPSVACYPGQLNQVFLNILINAKQAIAGKGVITITTFIEGNNVNIAIKDSGPGISPEDRDKVFEPGFTTKGVGVGTGLGLSICRHIMQVHRGGISVESERGKGATFTIYFPMNLASILEENVDSK
jgi:PAS domain S-box-containing protein